jgi:hypothetical protein
MRNPVTLAPVAIACLLLTAQAEPAKPSLCNAGEEVLFTCKSGHTKVVSVCASPDAGPATGRLVYRFGQVGRVPSLIYPTEAIAPQNAFKFAQGCSAKGCTEQLAFSVGEFKYTVYSEHYGGFAEPGQDAGVFVERDGHEVADIRCTDPLAPTDMYLIGSAPAPGRATSHFLGLKIGEARDVGPRVDGVLGDPNSH